MIITSQLCGFVTRDIQYVIDVVGLVIILQIHIDLSLAAVSEGLCVSGCERVWECLCCFWKKMWSKSSITKIFSFSIFKLVVQAVYPGACRSPSVYIASKVQRKCMIILLTMIIMNTTITVITMSITLVAHHSLSHWKDAVKAWVLYYFQQGVKSKK